MIHVYILDTDAELENFYRALFAAEYPDAEVRFFYTATGLMREFPLPAPARAEAPPAAETETPAPVTPEAAPALGTAEPATPEAMPAPEAPIEPAPMPAAESAPVPAPEPAPVLRRIVITETAVPDMDTFAMLQRLAEQDVPVIVVSSESSERMIVECLRSGASDYISKRNIKLGHFRDIIARALADGTDPELDRKIFKSLADEKSEGIRNRLSRGIVPDEEIHLKEGKHYRLIFTYVQLRFPADAHAGDADRLRYLGDRFLNRFSEIAARYGSRLSLRKADGCFFGFGESGRFQALVAALEILGQMNMFNATSDQATGPIQAALAITEGDVKYTSRIGDITSEALNLSAHMAMKADITGGILITGPLYRNMGQRAMKLFKPAGEFEGHEVYAYRHGAAVR